MLQQQLGIAWSFAEQVVLPQIHEPQCLWEPSEHVVTVRLEPPGWVADWPDEEICPLPESTIGWLLWHIEWWWTNAARAVRGEALIDHSEHLWSGSTSGVLGAKAGWDELLATTDLGLDVDGLMPTLQPFGFVAAWVNFELTKNLSEINQLLIRFSQRPG